MFKSRDARYNSLHKLGSSLSWVVWISSALQEQSYIRNLIAQSIAKIAQMTEENDATIKNAKLAADRLEKLSRMLKSLVARFRI